MTYELNDEINKKFEVDKYHPIYYAGASLDFNPIHIDNDFAKAAGLGGVILQGLCTMAFAYRAVIGNNDPSKLKKLKVRFRQPVKPLDILNISGKISSAENNAVSIDFFVENQNIEQVITNGLAIVET